MFEQLNVSVAVIAALKEQGITEPISTLLVLDQFLLEVVYKELAWNESYPELLHTHFHYGVSV